MIFDNPSPQAARGLATFVALRLDGPGCRAKRRLTKVSSSALLKT